jgi:hypothetical protein
MGEGNRKNEVMGELSRPEKITLGDMRASGVRGLLNLLRRLQLLALDHLRSPPDLIVTRHAFVTIKSPVCVVDRVLAHPFRKRRLRAIDALKKCDLRCQVTIGHDFFQAPSNGDDIDLAENSNDGHEHASDPHDDFAVSC